MKNFISCELYFQRLNTQKTRYSKNSVYLTGATNFSLKGKFVFIFNESEITSRFHLKTYSGYLAFKHIQPPPEKLFPSKITIFQNEIMP